MPVTKNQPDPNKFNPNANLPFGLRLDNFHSAMQDVYDFFFDVNKHLVAKSLERLDDMLRLANMSGMLSDMLTSSLAKHSRSLVVNAYHNGHPDLLVRGHIRTTLSRLAKWASKSSPHASVVGRWIPTVGEINGCVFSFTRWTTLQSLRSIERR